MSHQIRLDDDVYERVRARKQEGESFSDAVDRLINGRSLSDLGDVFDDEQATELRETIEAADETDRDEVESVAERFE